VEHSLEASGITKGRIDILAKDRFGQYVVIEIKKSNSTARETLHELHKYTGLLRINYRLAPDRIRCVVVSTQWKELLVPYSEFCRSFQYNVQGLLLTLDDHGNPVTVSKIIPLPEVPIGRVCPEHLSYLFTSSHRRDFVMEQLKSSLDHLGIKDYSILKMDYMGGNSNVIYSHAVYVVVDQFNDDMRKRLIKELNLDSEEIMEMLEINPYVVESMILASLYDTKNLEETVEIGYPEKFIILLSTWKVISVTCSGRWLLMKQSEDDDSELIQSISGIEGQNANYYQVFTSPRFRNRWEQAQADAAYCLQGNSVWTAAFNYFWETIAHSDPEVEVSVSVYNPLSGVLPLIGYLRTREIRSLPMLEIIASGGNEPILRSVIGFVIWDGQTFPKDVQTTLGTRFRDSFKMIELYMLGGLWEYDEKILRLHGMEYCILFIETDEKSQKVQRLIYHGKKLEFQPNDPASIYSVDDFVTQNMGYNRNLLEWYGNHVYEL